MEEAYCSFEVSKLLKEKGFDENTSMVYMSYGDLCKCNRYDSIHNSNYNDITKIYFECTAPTHQMAMRWLRELYEIDIIIFRHIRGERTTFYDRIEKRTRLEHQSKCNLYFSYEEAIEAALKYCLRNLI